MTPTPDHSALGTCSKCKQTRRPWDSDCHCGWTINGQPPLIGPTPDHSATPYWYAVVNDLVGGFAVASSYEPLSQQPRDAVTIADMCTEDDARLIARLLNDA